MNVVLQYILQNWGLILVLIAFVIMLAVTVFLDRKTMIRMVVLIAFVFTLSIVVFTEFYLTDINQYKEVRLVMMAIRYSATPFLLSFILYTLVKRARWYVLIPALLLAIVNIVSIFTGIVFSINDAGELVRGPLGYLPYIGVGIYSVFLVYILVMQSNKQAIEIIPIIFLASAFATGLILPFILGKEYSKIFCTTVGVALFAYYVFMVLQLTKKDALTGLLNRQAYYASLRFGKKDIDAIISIDMNGLKAINDSCGHVAGDEALTTLAHCFTKAAKSKQAVYRIGGDEFIIVCRRTTKDEMKQLINRIKDNVADTPYRVSIGYCYASKEIKDLEEMAKFSDQMMYEDKARYYSQAGIERRKQ